MYKKVISLCYKQTNSSSIVRGFPRICLFLCLCVVVSLAVTVVCVCAIYVISLSLSLSLSPPVVFIAG